MVRVLVPLLLLRFVSPDPDEFISLPPFSGCSSAGTSSTLSPINLAPMALDDSPVRLRAIDPKTSNIWTSPRGNRS
jgi:hypothetical protein